MLKRACVWLLLFAIVGRLWALPGLEYTQVQPSIHVLDIDPDLYEIRPVKALDNGIGRESVLSMARRHGAVACINAGFFSIGGTLDGRACGALKIHEWIALPSKPRGCIGWAAQDQNPQMDRLLVRIVGHTDDEEVVIDGLNRARKEGEAVLYNPSFHRTTLTDPDGEEVVVVDGVVQAIVDGGSTRIPERGYVLSIQEASPLFARFGVGQSLSFSESITPLLGATSSAQWEAFDYIVGGTPLLIHEERMLDFTAEQTITSFLSNRHARTAVGILPNGHWVFVVVDAEGMRMDELADFMAQLGCLYALNLDGGSSSTLVYEGAIKNQPDGDGIRRVSDAIGIYKKEGF